MAKSEAWQEDELEFKIVLPSADELDRVRKDLFKQSVSPLGTKSTIRYYFDTAGLDLYEDPRSIALRTQEGQQTFKYDLEAPQELAPGFAYRRECKSKLADALNPDMALVKDKTLRQILDAYLGRQLGLRHLMNTTRKFFNLEAQKRKSRSGLVEAGFDRVRLVVPAAQVSQEFFVGEIESKGGKNFVEKYDATMFVADRIMTACPSAYIDPYPSKNAMGMELYKKHVLKIK